MTQTSAQRIRLPVSQVLRDALLLPLRHPRELFMPLALPGCAIAAIMLGWRLTTRQMPAALDWTIYGLYGAAFTIFAVNCHRLVLLGPSAETVTPKPRWGARETRFLGWFIMLGALIAGIHLVVLLGMFDVVPTALVKTNINWIDIGGWIAKVSATYLVARLSLLLPATAIDGKVGLRWAWDQSAGNGWRLFVTVGVFPWLLSYSVSMMDRQDATLPEVVIMIVLNLVESTLGIVALSLSYDRLRSGKAVVPPT